MPMKILFFLFVQMWKNVDGSLKTFFPGLPLFFHQYYLYSWQSSMSLSFVLGESLRVFWYVLSIIFHQILIRIAYYNSKKQIFTLFFIQRHCLLAVHQLPVKGFKINILREIPSIDYCLGSLRPVLLINLLNDTLSLWKVYWIVIYTVLIFKKSEGVLKKDGCWSHHSKSAFSRNINI